MAALADLKKMIGKRWKMRKTMEEEKKSSDEIGSDNEEED